MWSIPLTRAFISIPERISADLKLVMGGAAEVVAGLSVIMGSWCGKRWLYGGGVGIG